jgi:hypothetical protein
MRQQFSSATASLDDAFHPHSSLLSSSFIHSLFGGVARNSVQCLVCQTVSVTHEFFLDLSLAIEAPRPTPAAKKESMASSYAQAAGATGTASATSSSSPAQKNKSVNLRAKGKQKHLSKKQRKLLHKKAKKIAAAAGSEGKEGEDVVEEEDQQQDGDDESGSDEGEREEGAIEDKKSGEQNGSDPVNDAVEASSSDIAAETAALKQVECNTDAAVNNALSDESKPSATVDAEPEKDRANAEKAVPSSPPDSAASAAAPSSAPVNELLESISNLSLTEGRAGTEKRNEEESKEDGETTTHDSNGTAADPIAAAIDHARTASSSVDAVSHAAAGPPACLASESASSLPSLFYNYLRSHGLGFDRLRGTASKPTTLLDCLGAFTDPDLLIGINKYGCSQCSRIATEERKTERRRSGEDKSAANAEENKSEETKEDHLLAAMLPLEPQPAQAASPVAKPPICNDTACSATFSCSAAAEAGGEVVPSSSPACASSASDEKAECASDTMESDPPPPPPPLLIKQNAVKRSLILVPPRILTLHLKRFHQAGKSLEKSSKAVGFPLCFDLSAFMCDQLPPTHVKPFTFEGTNVNFNLERPPALWYHLYAIVSHGGGMGGGHYVAYCRKQNIGEAGSRNSGRFPEPHTPIACQLEHRNREAWYYFSDSDVRAVSLSEVLKVQAYILFYERAECS